MKINYQKSMDDELSKINLSGNVPRLLLHACCAPCSSYVLEYLTEYFDITVYFYNPNITDSAEWKKRADEMYRLIEAMPHKNRIDIILADHSPERFYAFTNGLEGLAEGGERCFL